MYLIIENPARCDPFTEPRNTTEQIKVFGKILKIVCVGSTYMEATLCCHLYQIITWCTLVKLSVDSSFLSYACRLKLDCLSVRHWDVVITFAIEVRFHIRD